MSRQANRGTLRQLGFGSYQEYVRSAHWRQTKARFRASDREQGCYCCGEPRTQLHHKTYVRLGEELLDDLVPLCCRCHSLVHVLERRGDLTLDLAGLLDAARAKRYSAESRERTERTEAENDHGSRERAAYGESLQLRLKHATNLRDWDEARRIAVELREWCDQPGSAV